MDNIHYIAPLSHKKNNPNQSPSSLLPTSNRDKRKLRTSLEKGDTVQQSE